MCDGSQRAIEEVHQGELVLAREEGGSVACHEVTKTLARLTNEREDVAVVTGRRREVLHTTTTHPFWTKERGWTKAAELQAGEHLVGPSGERGVVEGTVFVPGVARVFNFEVDSAHSYFVGEEGVLVHNGDCALKLVSRALSAADLGLGGAALRVSGRFLQTGST
jgi:hypothetical protein